MEEYKKVCGCEETAKNEPHQLIIGTMLKEQYYIGRVLGQGGFGITYLGWDMYLDIPVAIKEYFPSGTVMRETSVSMDVVSYSGDVGVKFRNNKERFLREAKMLARFSQVPEIVQIKNFFLANNTAYIVMEYVDGITLKQYVHNQGGKLSSEQTLTLMEPVIKALCKVHKSGLVHRDISPDNIMMMPDGQIKLLDFGAVRDVGEADIDHPLTKSTEAILKQGYAPIEQYQNRGSLGPWTDVYALCATIYFCLTGEVPPDAPERLLGDEEINFKDLVPELTDRQAEALCKGIELRAQERIASMDELHRKLYLDAEEDAESLSKNSVQDNEKDDVQREGQIPRVKLTKSQKIAIAWIAVIVLVYGIGFAYAIGNIDAETAGETNVSVEVIAEGECGEGLTWSLDTEGVLVLDGEGQMDDYNGVWMDESNLSEGYNPEFSYAPWADYIQDIHTLIVGENVTKIGTCAFNDAVNLRDIQWSNNGNLQEIGWMAFANIGIEGVTIPAGVEVMGAAAFTWCADLQYVELPYRLASLEADTFVGCLKLGNVVMPPYTKVQDYTFEEEGREITVTPFFIVGYENEEDNLRPENLQIHTYRDSDAERFAKEYDVYHEYMHGGFCGDNIEWSFDSSTKTLCLDGYGNTWNYRTPEDQVDEFAEELGITQIFVEYPDWIYSFKEDIENVVVGDNIGCLNDYIFSNLVNLKNVEIGSSVAAMDFAFSGCTSLEEIVIPANVESMGSLSFENCTNLRKVTFEGDNTYICDGTFRNAVNLEEVHCSKGMSVAGEYKSPFDDPHTDDDTWSDKVVLYVYEGSPMHDFAKENGFAFEIVE